MAIDLLTQNPDLTYNEVPIIHGLPMNPMAVRPGGYTPPELRPMPY